MVGVNGSKLLMILSAPSSSSASQLRQLSPLLSFSAISFSIAFRHPLHRSLSRPFYAPFSSSSYPLSHIPIPPTSSSSFVFAAKAAFEGFHTRSALKDDFLVDGRTEGSNSRGTSLLPPEWEQLIHNLRVKGYLNEPSGRLIGGYDDGEDVLFNPDQLPADFVVAARACLAFARHHPDALRSLSKKDVEIIVENEPPLLFQKVANSVHRIRGFLDNPQEKAYTVDVMNLVLSYVRESVVPVVENIWQGRNLVEASVCRLLGELAEACGAMESNVPNSISNQFSHANGQSTGSVVRNIETKPGDWTCPKCSFMNFARNVRCRECSEARPRRQLTGGEWACPQCDFYNYGRNTVCLRCDCRRPVETLFGGSPQSNLNSQNSEKNEVKLLEKDENDQGWFSKVSQLNDDSNRKKDRSLTSPQYKRKLGMEQPNSSNFVPFVPFPPDYFAKKDPQTDTRNTGSTIPMDQNVVSGFKGSVDDEKAVGTAVPKESMMSSRNMGQQAQHESPPLNNWSNRSTPTTMEGSQMGSGVGFRENAEQFQNIQSNIPESGGSKAGFFTGKSLEGSAVKDPDPLDMSEEAKAQRWFRRVAQIKDISELSNIPDEDFPQIMPMRKGVNRFVVSKRKTPLERRLTSPQYRRNLPIVSSDPDKGKS